jgi:hypothetical protein
MLKLFKVTYWYDHTDENTTFSTIVIAGNDIEAKRIVEEEAYGINCIKIKDIQEIHMTTPQLVCYIDTTV